MYSLQIVALAYVSHINGKPAFNKENSIDFEKFTKTLSKEQIADLLALAEKHNINTKEEGCALFKKNPEMCPKELVSFVQLLCSS